MSYQLLPSCRSHVMIVTVALASLVMSRNAGAQGFISPSFGYNFGGDAGCLTATDCENKNWNLGVSLGSFGPLLGFEAELTYEDQFLGEGAVDPTSVLTVMGNFMLAPKIAIVRPYGLAGLGVLRTSVDHAGGGTTSDNQWGWTVGAGLVVYVNRHVGLKGDIRHYHAFQSLEFLGFDLTRVDNKLDFGRAAFGVVLGF